LSESKNKLISHAQIHWSDQSEPISSLFNDIYYNTDQGIDESFYVFFQGNQLTDRWLTCQSEYFVIAETGFGTGLNFLVCCAQFNKFLNQYPDKPLKRLIFTSFEKYPLCKDDLRNALQRWPSLQEYTGPLLAQYPLALTGCHRILLEQFNITLDLWFGDVQQTLPALYHHASGLFDCWYLDGFAPSKNPEMWSEQLFKQIAQSCKAGATIATFTAAGFVRRGLLPPVLICKNVKVMARSGKC
jgi:tRNA 5-methylaminomethyl-2-thiouridine biosynthesis bifunctional protein